MTTWEENLHAGGKWEMMNFLGVALPNAGEFDTGCGNFLVYPMARVGGGAYIDGSKLNSDHFIVTELGKVCFFAHVVVPAWLHYRST